MGILLWMDLKLANSRCKFPSRSGRVATYPTINTPLCGQRGRWNPAQGGTIVPPWVKIDMNSSSERAQEKILVEFACLSFPAALQAALD